MEEKCQARTDCNEEVNYECECKSPAVLLCKKHLEVHLLTTVQGSNHHVKPVLVNITEHCREIVQEEIVKMRKNLVEAQAAFTVKIRGIVEKAYKKFYKGIEKIKNADSLLKELSQYIEKVQTIKLHRTDNPTVLRAFQVPDEQIAETLKSLELLTVTLKHKSGLISVKIKEKLSYYLRPKRNTLNFTEGKCLKGHKLLLSTDSSKYYSFINNIAASYICDLCREQYPGNNLHCRLCSFDICEHCALRKEFKFYSPIQCKNKHELKWITNISSLGVTVNCDFCRARYANSGWRCLECDFDVCSSCSIAEGVQPAFEYPMMCDKGHRLMCENTNTLVTCKICCKEIVSIHWRCSECNFGVCADCAAVRGHKLAHCEQNHTMVNVLRAKKIFNFRSDCCKNCGEKLDGIAFNCQTCKNFLCEKCFIECPSMHVR
jgi:hypothetical protein